MHNLFLDRKTNYSTFEAKTCITQKHGTQRNMQTSIFIKLTERTQNKSWVTNTPPVMKRPILGRLFQFNSDFKQFPHKQCPGHRAKKAIPEPRKMLSSRVKKETSVLFRVRPGCDSRQG